MRKDPKLMIMGLDAATGTLARPEMGEGGMPNLAKLVNAGAFGKVESILRPITSPARPGRTAQAVTAADQSAKVEKRLQARGYLG